MMVSTSVVLLSLPFPAGVRPDELPQSHDGSSLLHPRYWT